jgi:DNA modification methylase
MNTSRPRPKPYGKPPEKKPAFAQPKPMVQTTSLWDFPSQHYGNEAQGDSEYIGVTPAYIIWNVLQRYTRDGDTVLDPMCGSGTTLDVCKDLGRTGIGFDLNPSKPAVKQADARKIPLEKASVDFIFVDPPYSNHIEYSDDERCLGKLSARSEDYYKHMGQVFAEFARVLRVGGYLALYVSDSAEKGKTFCPIGFELFARLAQHFEPVDIIACVRHNKKLKRNHWHTSAIEGNFFLRGFNYLFIFHHNPSGDPKLRRHEAAGALSTHFKTLSTQRPLVTPEVLGNELLTNKDAMAEAARNRLKRQRRKENKRVGGIVQRTKK